MTIIIAPGELRGLQGDPVVGLDAVWEVHLGLVGPNPVLAVPAALLVRVAEQVLQVLLLKIHSECNLSTLSLVHWFHWPALAALKARIRPNESQ